MSGSIKTLTLLNRLMRGVLTGVTLNDALADPATLGAFKTGLTQRAFCAALINDAAVAAIVFASTRASSACFESAGMRKAIWGSDTALAAIAASATAIAAARAASATRTVETTCSPVAVLMNGITFPCLLVGWSFSYTNNSLTLTGRRAGSTVGALVSAAGSIIGTTAAFDNVMALGPYGTVSGKSSDEAYLCVLPL